MENGLALKPRITRSMAPVSGFFREPDLYCAHDSRRWLKFSSG